MNENYIKLDTLYYENHIQIIDKKTESTKLVFRVRSYREAPWPMFKQNPQRTGQNLNAINDNPGRIRWKLNLGDFSTHSGPIISINNTIYQGFRLKGGVLYYSINDTSLINWDYPINNQFPEDQMCIDNFLNIYFTTNAGYLYSINPNGDENWNISEISINTPIFHPETKLIIWNENGELCSYYTNGTIRWRLKINNWMYHVCPSISNNGTIYSSDSKGNIISVTKNGEFRWKHPFQITSLPTIDDFGNIYFGNKYGLTCIYPNGSIKWNFSTGYEVNSCPSINDNNDIIFGCSDGKLYSISNDGNENWNFSTESSIESSSPAIDGKGVTYIGSIDKNLYSIHPNGSLKWKIKLSESILDSPAIDNNGNIYVSTYNGYLYSIGAIKPTIPNNRSILSGNRYVNVSWDLPIDDGGAEILNFNVYRNTSGTDPELFASVPASDLFFNDTDVINGVEYSYWISAVNREGESDLAGPFNATPRGPPSTPRNVSVSSGPAYLNISWEGPLTDGGYPIEGYRIYRKEAGIFLLHAETTNHFYIDDVANPGVNYSYYIKAVNQYGEGPPTSIFFGMSVGVPPPPDPVSFERLNEAIRIDWSMGLTGLEEYEITKIRIYRDEEVVTEVSTYNKNFNDTGLINGVNYTYQLSGINAAGEGSLSMEYTISPAWIPTPPLHLSARATSSKVELSWSPPVDDRGSQIISYRVYRRQPDENWSKVTDLKDMSWTDTDVETGRTYEYTVDCYNEIGPSNTSQKVTVTILEQDPPPAPILKEIDLTEERNVHLKWESDTKDDGLFYHIYRSITQDSGFVEIDSTNDYTYLDSENIIVNNTYYYYVTASDEFGESEPSNILNIFIEGPSGDDDPNGDDPSPNLFVFGIIVIVVLILAVLSGIFFMVKNKKGSDKEQFISHADDESLIVDDKFQIGEEQSYQTGLPYVEESRLFDDHRNAE